MAVIILVMLVHWEMYIAFICLFVLFFQIFLGAWTSTNYASLACPDFPTCQGTYLPEMDFESGFNLKQEIGDLSRITSWVRVFGMVNSAPGYDEQHIVINGFSELILEVFGSDKGRHSRSAIGVVGLPMNLAIEIEGEVLIK